MSRSGLHLYFLTSTFVYLSNIEYQMLYIFYIVVIYAYIVVIYEYTRIYQKIHLKY